MAKPGHGRLYLSAETAARHGVLLMAKPGHGRLYLSAETGKFGLSIFTPWGENNTPESARHGVTNGHMVYIQHKN